MSICFKRQYLVYKRYKTLYKVIANDGSTGEVHCPLKNGKTALTESRYVGRVLEFDSLLIVESGTSDASFVLQAAATVMITPVSARDDAIFSRLLAESCAKLENDPALEIVWAKVTTFEAKAIAIESPRFGTIRLFDLAQTLFPKLFRRVKTGDTVMFLAETTGINAWKDGVKQITDKIWLIDLPSDEKELEGDYN